MIKNQPHQKKKNNGQKNQTSSRVFRILTDARQADNYVKVTEAILIYVQRTYTHGSDVKISLEDGMDFDFEKVRPGGRNTGDIKISLTLI